MSSSRTPTPRPGAWPTKWTSIRILARAWDLPASTVATLADEADRVGAVERTFGPGLTVLVRRTPNRDIGGRVEVLREGEGRRERARERARARVREHERASTDGWADWRASQRSGPARRPPEVPLRLKAPPIGCPDHPNGVTDRECGPCGTAAEYRKTWLERERFAERLAIFEEEEEAEWDPDTPF